MRDNVFSAANQQGSPSQTDPSETIRRIPHMNRELAWLLALLFTDGCVSPKGVHSFRIYFLNKSEVLVQLFKDCMIKVFNLPEKRVRIRTRWGKYIQAVVDSKEIGKALVGTYGTFRTLRLKDRSMPNTQLPVAQLQASGYTHEFLKVAFSCDGGISFYPATRNGPRGGTKWLIRTVFLSCTHPRLRHDYFTLLQYLGIMARDVPTDGKIKIETSKDIKKFYETVGFLDGVEVTNHSKFWRGVTKQEVLQRLVASYGKPAQVYNLPRFSEVMR